MKKICDFVNAKKRAIVIAALILMLIFAAGMVFTHLSDIKSLGDELINAVIPLVVVLIFSLVVTKIIPNKRYTAGCMIFFSSVMALFMIINIVSLRFSGTLVAAPICIMIFLLTAAKIWE